MIVRKDLWTFYNSGLMRKTNILCIFPRLNIAKFKAYKIDPRTVPQSFEIPRGVHQSFEMARGVAQQYDMTRGVTQPFEMSRGNTGYEMPRGPQGYEMTRANQSYEMPRTQPYEMARGGTQPIDMARGGVMEVTHPYDYPKNYQQCPEPQPAGPAKTDAPHHMPDAHQGLEIPMEMPKTAPQPTVKPKSGAQKTSGHPFDFAKGYAQQLEMAKRAAQNAIQAKVQAQKVEKARQEAEQAEKTKREAEEEEKAKQEAEELEKAKTATQPSEILKLYAQQLEMMKNAAKPSEIAKMYSKQLEMAKASASKSEKSRKSGPYCDRSRRGKTSVGKVNGGEERDGVSLATPCEEMDTDDSDNKQSHDSKGDPPPFEMAKYLAQLSKITKGGVPPLDRDDSQSSEGGKSESQHCDTDKGDLTPSSTEAAKTSGLPFPFELMKNLGLPFGMSIPGVGNPRAKRDRQELTIANKAKLIEQVEARGAKKKADIAREWGLRPSTLSTIMKNKDRILTQFKSQRYAAGRRRMRTAAYPDVEEALLTWFRYARAANIPITGPVLQGMGVTLAQELGHPEFSCSVGWLDRFKARHGLSFNPKNNQDTGGGTFNEPADRQPSPLPPVPTEASSDSETSPNSWFPPAMPAVETTPAAPTDNSANAWFPNTLPNINSTSVTETQDQLNKWFPIALGEEPSEDAVAPPPTEDPTSTWFYNTVPSLLRDNKPRDIFSASEAALFYNLLPDRSLAVKGEDGHKWTWVKERLTFMVGVNMDGSEKLPLLVIGQMKDPRAVMDVDTLPLPYEANDSAMMTSSIFESWVRQLDEQYQNLNRNIIILVDSCPAHPHVDDLNSVQLIFLPKDSTSQLQPVEQGVIQNLKTVYRRSVLERLIEYNEKGQEYEITLLEAMGLLEGAWKQIKTELIVKSFKQVGLEPLEDLDDATLGGEDEHALLERARRSGIDIPGDVTFESYLNVDSQVQTTMEQSEDGATDQGLGGEGTEAGSAAGTTLPSEAMHALATLRKFIQEQGGPDHYFDPLIEMESWVAKHIVKPEVSFTSE
ncbi:Tigger transposable element-derived protein 4-like 1 [Homarus americanus]|uniref:Tigger transposable element-derived protein 4-like 1 n=1 Tax=Homarus americanus TaxID=6706 RepID=A0A8J5N1L4_HOMAM|nr:Tigger transposable element-derived protein 4-like 1 [Homarus americanus]